MTNCVFITLFHNPKYIHLFNLLIDTIYKYGNLSDDIDVVVYTSTDFANKIRVSPQFSDKLYFEINDNYDNIDQACKARLDLFSLPLIEKYEKILYLDTDILVKGDLHHVFKLAKKEVIYAIKDGFVNCGNDFWGCSLFGDELYHHNGKMAFSSGVMLFLNCKKIRDLFDSIKKDIIKRPCYFQTYDQPYIVYNAFHYDLYDNTTICDVAGNNIFDVNSNHIIHHFPGSPGSSEPKLVLMEKFMAELLLAEVK
jgi:lipopolysaccharide biosynthesis glycosyltransferase